MNRLQRALIPAGFLFLFGIFVGGMAVAEDNPLATVEGADDLEQVKRARFRETWVNTSVDFKRYDKLFLGEGVFLFRNVPGSGKKKGAQPISEEDRRKFEEIVGEAFRKEIAKGKHFTVVENNEADENTIVVRGVVADIVSWAPPRHAGIVDTYMATVGEATLALELLDGKSGEVLARVAERGRIGNARGQIDGYSMPVNRATIIANVKRWARDAARKLRLELDSALS